MTIKHYKKNSDGFELEFRQSMDKYIKNKVAYEFIKLNFHKIKNKEICEIIVSPKPVPIFVSEE
jgi:hypothetical protein